MAPEGWRDLPLSELATVVGGGTPSKSQPAYWNGDVPWATPTDVTGLKGRVISETNSTITDEGLANSSSVLLPPRSLLMTTRATIGACAVNQVSMATNQGFQSLVPKEGARVEFLYYLIQHHKRRLERLAAGSTFLEVSKRAIRDFRVVVPPLPEQRKIAAILSSVDDAIEKTRSVIDQVRVVKRGLMQELLARGLLGWHTRFKQTEIGEIPEEWQIAAIGDLGHDSRITVRSGPFGSSMKTKDFRSSGVPVITIKSLGEDDLIETGLFFVSRHKADELSEYSVAEGDLVFSRVADIGRSLTVDEQLSGWLISPNLIRIRPDRRKVNARFMMYAITLAKGVLRQIDSIAGNTGRPVVSSSILRLLRIPIPPLSEQREIACAGRRLESRIRMEAARLDVLKELKFALMSILLTGELRVTPDPEAS